MRRLYTGLIPPKDLKARHCPFIEIIPRPVDDPEVARMLDTLPQATHLIFTSKTTVDIFFQYSSKFKNKTFIAVGKVTKSYLQSRGVYEVLTPEIETAEGITALIASLNLKEPFFVWPHSARSRRVIPDFLDRKGISYCECVLYDTATIIPDPLPDLDDYDEILFTSPSTVEGFVTAYGKLPQNKQLTPIGPITQQKLSDYDY